MTLPRFPDFSRLSAPRRWLALAAASLALASLLVYLRVPAGILMGGMWPAVFLAVAGARVRTPKLPFAFAQALVGCLIASSLTSEAIDGFVLRWPLFLSMVVSVSALSSLIGWLLARTGMFPGSTAIWGTSPGAALLMTVMSESHGADPRLVAFMQYLRVFMVTLFAAFLPYALGTAAHPVAPGAAAAGAGPGGVLWALGLAAGGVILGRLSGFASAPMLFPLLAAPLLSAVLGRLNPLPPWQLLAPAYLLIGWNIGMRFTPDTVRHALRILPRVAASIAGLIAACTGLAWLYALATNLPFLTAYLACSPGGMDSVAIIAASVGEDTPLIMAVQAGRYLFVILTGPLLANFLTRKLDRAGK
ncbi:MAG: AbrB family transcriptional regulator [Planctomycetota bacterium]|jgi:membrane AbrB-like protein|nr:AbrB family transcriptional regulator [Planctomycetota bacterium]